MLTCFSFFIMSAAFGWSHLLRRRLTAGFVGACADYKGNPSSGIVGDGDRSSVLNNQTGREIFNSGFEHHRMEHSVDRDTL